MFASRQLSVVEKRKLMRFLTSCMEETEEQKGETPADVTLVPVCLLHAG